MPAQFKVADKDVGLEGGLIDVDRATGRAKKIKRNREHIG